MKESIRSIGGNAFAWMGGLALMCAGCTTYVTQAPPGAAQAPPPPVAYAPPPPAEPPVVEIRAAADFYEPLNPYGAWVEVPPYEWFGALEARGCLIYR